MWKLAAIILLICFQANLAVAEPFKNIPHNGVNQDTIKPVYDLIVVGLGASGSVVCSRLTQAGFNILCVEAGLDWTFSTESLIGTQWGSWQMLADPQPTRGTTRQDVEVGKTAGGSFQLSNNGWEWGTRYWADRTAAYVKDARFNYNATACIYENIIERDYLETTGKIQIKKSYNSNSFGSNWAATASSFGYPVFQDCNDPNKGNELYCYESSSIKWIDGNGAYAGNRSSSWVEYVRSTFNYPNVDMAVGTRLLKLYLSKGRIDGIRILIADINAVDVKAKLGVILATDAINTAAILQRAGIGNATALSALGIQPYLDLPAVGKLQDAGYNTMRWTSNINCATFSCAPPDGFTANKPIGFIRTSLASSPDADLMLIVSPRTSGSVFAFLYDNDNNGVGQVYLKTADPLIEPNVQYNYVNSGQLAQRVQFVNTTREIMARLSSIGGYNFVEQPPSSNAVTNAQISAMLLGIPENGGIAPSYHYGSTARMGPFGDTANSVVNPNFQVHGMSNLFVVSNAAYSFAPAPGGIAPGVLTGERASAIISRLFCNNCLNSIYAQCGF